MPNAASFHRLTKVSHASFLVKGPTAQATAKPLSGSTDFFNESKFAFWTEDPLFP
jgi:hypothetical protein